MKELLKIVESSSDVRAATHDFILQLPTETDRYECAVQILNIGAEFYDKIAAVVVEAWETNLKDGLWQVRFSSSDEAKKVLGSKAVNNIRRLYSISIGRKGKAMERIISLWGSQA